MLFNIRGISWFMVVTVKAIFLIVGFSLSLESFYLRIDILINLTLNPICFWGTMWEKSNLNLLFLKSDIRVIGILQFCQSGLQFFFCYVVTENKVPLSQSSITNLNVECTSASLTAYLLSLLTIQTKVLKKHRTTIRGTISVSTSSPSAHLQRVTVRISCSLIVTWHGVTASTMTESLETTGSVTRVPIALGVA